MPLPPLSPRAWLRHDLITRRLRTVPAGSSVLEIGVGQGAMAVRMARRFRWTGVEADTTSASVARARLEADDAQFELHETRFEDAPLSPPYDVVVAFEVLEHIEDDGLALRTWYDLLAPGGLIVLSVPAWQHRLGPWDDRVGHFRRYDPDHLAAALTEAGYVDPDVDLYGFPLDYVLETARNTVARRGPAPEAATGTAQSGRLFQPNDPRVGAVMRTLTRPFRMIQDSVDGGGRLGTGLVGSAQRPR